MSANTCRSNLRRRKTGALERLAIAPLRWLKGVILGLVEQRTLDALSHHSLKDIGLARAEIDRYMGKPSRLD